jgi:hypothetical protein
MNNIGSPRAWSWLALVALPLAAARCGGDGDDDAAPGAAGGGAGKAGAGRGGSSGVAAGASGQATGGRGGKGGAGGKSGEGGEGGSGAESEAGGTAGSEAGSNGQAGATPAGMGGAGDTGGSSAGGEGGARAGAGGESGSSACDYQPISTCSNDLSNIGTGDFEIALELRSPAVSASAIASQRQSCGESYFWDLRMADGLLGFELDDNGAHYAACRGTVPVNDRNTHSIVIRRESLVVSMYVDCQLDVTCSMPASLSMPLPAVEVGFSPCSDAGSGDGTSPLIGKVSSLCVGGI